MDFGVSPNKIFKVQYKLPWLKLVIDVVQGQGHVRVSSSWGPTVRSEGHGVDFWYLQLNQLLDGVHGGVVE